MANITSRPESTTLPGSAWLYALDLTIAGAEDRKVSVNSLAKIFGGSPSVSKEFFVDKSGDDTDNDGGLLSPFLTIQKAIDAINALGNASASNIYVINVNSGEYAENINLPAFVVLRGYSSGQKPTYIDGTVGIDTTKCPVVSDTYIYISEIFAKNINFNGVISGGNYLRLFLYSVTIENIFQISMGGCYPILRAFNIDHLANSEYFYIGNNTNAELIQFYGRLNSNASGTAINIYSSSVRALDINGSVSITIVSSYVGSYTSLGTAAASFDICSFPQGTISHGSSVAITLTSGSNAVKYVAAAPADWAGTPPATVQEAIDRIAAFNPGA